MSSAELAPELIHAVAPVAQGIAGNAASPEAIQRLSSQMHGPTLSVKSRRKVLQKLKAALVALRTGDFNVGAKRALGALEIDEASGLGWHILAICQEKSGDFGQALLAYEAAMKLAPKETDVAQDLGRLAQQMGELDIAEKLFVKYLSTNPGDIEATNNLSCVLRDQKRYGEAVEMLRALLAIEAESPVLWNTLGTVLSDQGDMSTALTFFNEALRLHPDFAKAHYNRSTTRHALGDMEGALADLETAMPGAESAFERSMMNMSRALQLMAMGRLGEAFDAYEARLDQNMPDVLRVLASAPRWDPATETIRGKRLLIVGEQGLADEMLFAGCIGDAIEDVGPEGKVFIAVERRMVEMFQRSFPAAMVGAHRSVKQAGQFTRFVPLVEELTADGQGVDCWTPMASLLAVYRRSIEDFPNHAGYLKVDPDRVAHWRGELDKLGDGLKVGLHWKSLVLTGSRARYFSSFQRWRRVLSTPGTMMVNLQCGDVTEDLAEAEASGVTIWTPPIDLKNDLEDVAALSAAVDIVIGPGIAGTNLAAATGANTWMIIAPDDWQLLGTHAYPYYPGMRVYRRATFDGWDEVMERLRSDLEEAVRIGNAR